MATTTIDGLLQTATTLREEFGDKLHDQISESIYTDATQIADRVVTRDGHPRAGSVTRTRQESTECRGR